MLDYLIKRVLVMIPTFIGVSLMIWLVMTLAPGEPDAPGAGGMQDGQEGGALKDLESKNRTARTFRRQFNLDRPRFWNNWMDLSAQEVRVELEIVRGGVSEHGTTRVKKARRKLDDWQHYAVPPLVELLASTSSDHALQDVVLQYLRQSVYTYRPDYPSGYVPTDEERAEEEAGAVQNRLIDQPEFRFDRTATDEVRAKVSERWTQWFEENAHKYSYGTWDTFKKRIGDTQFGKYWYNVAHFDFGQSTRTKEPVLEMILSRFKYSLSLAVPSFVLAWILAIFLGVFSATHHGKLSDQSIGVGLFMLYSIPTYVMATILQQKFAVDTKTFPISGFESQGAKTTMTTWEHLKDVLWHITLPMICYTYGGLAYISRQARSGMLQVLKSDFVRTARAKGLKERTVIWRHAVRNGMMPIVTLLGTALPVLVAGSLFIETVFDIDGFGRLMITSIFNKDYNVVMGIQLIVAALTLIGLLLTDLIYAAMDPRISFK